MIDSTINVELKENAFDKFDILSFDDIEYKITYKFTSNEDRIPLLCFSDVGVSCKFLNFIHKFR